MPDECASGTDLHGGGPEHEPAIRAAGPAKPRTDSRLPRLPSRWLARPRLFERLEQWSPLTVVHGPPGSGKTVLVGSWLASQSHDGVVALWLSADSSLASGARLWERLAEALARAGRLPPGDGPPLARIADALLAVPEGQRIMIVIDNFDQLPDLAPIREMRHVLEVSHQVHLCLCTRGGPTVEAAVAASFDACRIGASDLALEAREVQALAARVGVVLPADDANRLHQAFGGWLAPTRLAIDEAAPGRRGVAVGQQYVCSAVLEVFGGSDTLDPLLRWSLAPFVDPRMPGDLDDGPGGRAALQLATRYGLVGYEPSDRWRFAPAVQGALADLERDRHPEEARSFHCRLARWFLAHDGPGHGLIALRQARQAEDWPLMATVLAERGTTLTMEAPEALVSMLESLPDAVTEAHPGLLISLWALKALLTGRDEGAHAVTFRTYGRISDRVLRSLGDRLSPLERLQASTGRMVWLRIDGRLAEAGAVGTELAQSLERAVASGAIGDRVAWCSWQCGLTDLLLGDDLHALQRFQDAWAQASAFPRNWVAAVAAGHQALVYALRGDAATARAWLARYRSFDTRDLWGHRVVEVAAHVAGGILALDRLDREAVESELGQLGDASEPFELWPLVAFLRARFALHFADPAGGLAELDAACAAHARGHQDPPALAVVLLARARADLLIATGNGAPAIQLVEALLPDAPMLAVPAGLVHLRAGDERTSSVVTSRQLASEDLPSRHRLELLLLQALAALPTDQVSAARLGRHALGVYRATGVLEAFTLVPPASLVRLLELAGERLETREAAALASHRHPYPERIPLLRLTARERALLAGLARSATRQEIAHTLHVSVNTVKTELQRLYRKLGVSSREAALRVAEMDVLAG